MNTGWSQRFSRPDGSSGRRRRCTQPRHPDAVADPELLEPRRQGRSTVPTISWPGIRGSLGWVNSPSTTCRSVRQTPQARTRMSTCSGPGRGTGTSAAGVVAPAPPIPWRASSRGSAHDSVSSERWDYSNLQQMVGHHSTAKWRGCLCLIRRWGLAGGQASSLEVGPDGETPPLPRLADRIFPGRGLKLELRPGPASVILVDRFNGRVSRSGSKRLSR